MNLLTAFNTILLLPHKHIPCGEQIGVEHPAIVQSLDTRHAGAGGPFGTPDTTPGGSAAVIVVVAGKRVDDDDDDDELLDERVCIVEETPRVCSLSIELIIEYAAVMSPAPVNASTMKSVMIVMVYFSPPCPFAATPRAPPSDNVTTASLGNELDVVVVAAQSGQYVLVLTGPDTVVITRV